MFGGVRSFRASSSRSSPEGVLFDLAASPPRSPLLLFPIPSKTDLRVPLPAFPWPRSSPSFPQSSSANFPAAPASAVDLSSIHEAILEMAWRGLTGNPNPPMAASPLFSLLCFRDR